MEVFKRDIRVGDEGLRLQALFKHLQDAAGDQCIPLHLTGPDLEKKGLMWVIIRYRMEIVRWPQPGETFTLNTWPGPARHGMMPRFYTLRDAAGEKLLSVSSVWAVVDRQTRSMVNNEDFQVHLDALVTGEEIRLPGVVRRRETTENGSFVVPAEYLDSNGHMNNTHYYTVAEHCIGRDVRTDRLTEVCTEHVNEALCGEEIALHWSQEDGLYYIAGECGGKPVFKMTLRYE